MTAALWMPGVIRRTIPNRPGGTMAGGTTRKAIIHTTETGGIPAYLPEASRPGSPYPPHVTWEPRTGVIQQHIPANLSAYALLNAAGGVETNRLGMYCIQVEVVGFAVAPFTDRPMIGWERIRAWLQSLGVPAVWPCGRPPAYPPAPPASSPLRSKTLWLTHSGYFSHSQVPENLHGDPGRIDITEIPGPAPGPPTPGGDDELTPAQAQLLADLHAEMVQEAHRMGVWDNGSVGWLDRLAKARARAAHAALGVPDTDPIDVSAPMVNQ